MKRTQSMLSSGSSKKSSPGSKSPKTKSHSALTVKARKPSPKGNEAPIGGKSHSANKTSPKGKEAPEGEGNKSHSASKVIKSHSASKQKEPRILKGMAMVGPIKSVKDLIKTLSNGGIDGGWWDTKNIATLPIEVETKPPTKRSSRTTQSVFRREVMDTERIVGVYRGPALVHTLASRRKCAADYCLVEDYPDVIVSLSLNVYLNPNSILFAELAFLIGVGCSS
jgi:hypothetical protein